MANNGPYYARGVYRGEIIDQGLTKASTGTVQVALKIKVLEGVSPAYDVEAQYERTIFLPVTERTMEYLVPKLESIGYSRDSLKFLDLRHPQCHDLRGTEAEFFCKHEPDQSGGMRERWDVATGGSGKALELKPPDEKEVRTLDMLFGRARKQHGTAPAPQRQPVQPQSEMPPTAPFDDVPF